MRAQMAVPPIYIVFLLLPIYWLLNMSLKTNEEILSVFHPLAAPISPLTTTG
jgi:glycerol transport system permease protein